MLAREGGPATELDADAQRLPKADGEAVVVADAETEDVCELCALLVDCGEPEEDAAALAFEDDVGASSVGDMDAGGDNVPLTLVVSETQTLTVDASVMLPEGVLQDVGEAVAVELCVGTPLAETVAVRVGVGDIVDTRLASGGGEGEGAPLDVSEAEPVALGTSLSRGA
jgi:hypothetical protein